MRKVKGMGRMRKTERLQGMGMRWWQGYSKEQEMVKKKPATEERWDWRAEGGED